MKTNPALANWDGFRGRAVQRCLCSAALILAFLWVSLAGVAHAQVVTEFAIPDLVPFRILAGYPSGIAAGLDGNLWFTESGVQANGLTRANAIGRITPTGVISQFFTPTPGSRPVGIAASADGNLWFTESGTNQIGRITPAGVVTEFSTPTANSAPVGITAGPDGNLWFTESGANQIGRVTPAGVVTEFSIPTANSGPAGIAAGSDGSLWFTERFGNNIGRITTAGVVTEVSIPTPGSYPSGIAAGPDTNLWFTESGGIGRVTPAGVVTEFSIPTANGAPVGIAAGPDGNLWFTESGANQIGRITQAGVVTEFFLLTPTSFPGAITAGSDGNLWFAENQAFQIGRITTSGEGSANCSPDLYTLCLNGGRFALTALWAKAGAEGSGVAFPITDDTGAFWFFSPSNIEVVTKVLAACTDPFHSFWVFAAGLTNVEVTLTYVDTTNRVSKSYVNPLGTPFQPIQDTAAFACP